MQSLSKWFIYLYTINVLLILSVLGFHTESGPHNYDFEDSTCWWKKEVAGTYDATWERVMGDDDHTYENNKLQFGYYMKLKMSRMFSKDNVKSLRSPAYDKQLAKRGCFQFHYKRGSAYVVGHKVNIRVYQKPTSLSGTAEKHLLFSRNGAEFSESEWHRGITRLYDFDDHFQIIIEGVVQSTLAFIAIDDVAILQGDNCKSTENEPLFPSTNNSIKTVSDSSQTSTTSQPTPSTQPPMVPKLDGDDVVPYILSTSIINSTVTPTSELLVKSRTNASGVKLPPVNKLLWLYVSAGVSALMLVVIAILIVITREIHKPQKNQITSWPESHPQTSTASVLDVKDISQLYATPIPKRQRKNINIKHCNKHNEGSGAEINPKELTYVEVDTVCGGKHKARNGGEPTYSEVVTGCATYSNSAPYRMIDHGRKDSIIYMNVNNT